MITNEPINPNVKTRLAMSTNPVPRINNHPMVIDNKAMNIFLLISITDKINGYIIKRMPIFTAKKKFTLKDLDLDIHNTHFKDSEKGLFMDSYFAENYGKDNETKIYQQMIKLFSKIIQLRDLKCDSKHCFEIFGADIMITDDFRIKLLEINDRIALKLSDEKLNYYWFDIFYNLINNNKIKSAFHINNLIN